MSVKRVDIAEFRREGYLQEVNRRFFHPLGLALEVVVGDDGAEALGGVWDYRDDPEGIYYEDAPSTAKADRIATLEDERKTPRIRALGYWAQPATGDE